MNDSRKYRFRILEIYDSDGNGIPWIWFDEFEQINAEIEKHEGRYHIAVTPLCFTRNWNPTKSPVPRAWADQWYIDIDVEGDLPSALSATKQAMAHLTNSWQIPAEAMTVSFSGSKGFHLAVDINELAGLAPSERLHLYLEGLRDRLRQELNLGTIIDLCLKGPRQAIRIVNTRHLKSGLYKIELSPVELQAGPEHILELAQNPRGEPGLPPPIQHQETSHSPIIADIISGVISEVDEAEDQCIELGARSELQGFIDKIRERVHLLDLLQGKYGARLDPVVEHRGHWSISCPFHNEGKRPNGVLWKEPLPYYRCYSTKCGVEGDVISIFMNIHRVTLREALQTLAKRARLIVPRDLFRAIERDKQIHNQMVIHRLEPGSVLAGLLRQSSALYEDLLSADLAYCMDPSTVFHGDNSCFFHSISRFTQRKGGDRRANGYVLNRLLVTGLVCQLPDDLSVEANAIRRKATRQSGYIWYSRHFYVPRLIDEVLQHVSRKAELIAPLGKRLSAKLRDELLEAGSDLDQFQDIVTKEIQRHQGTVGSVTSAVKGIVTDTDATLPKSELRKRLLSHGFTAHTLDCYLGQAILKAGLTELIGIWGHSTPTISEERGKREKLEEEAGEHTTEPTRESKEDPGLGAT